MISLVSPNAYFPPVPIPPVAPNFVLCNEAYGTNLLRDDAITAASMLAQGAMPVTYSVQIPELEGRGPNVTAPPGGYSLPFLDIFAGIAISVDVSGPVDITEISLVPNDIRGMAAFVANQCLGQGRVGGFVTRRIQGLVDFVTDPTSDIDRVPYPDSAAFLTVTVSSHEASAAFPGDFDPQVAGLLWKSELDAFERAGFYYRYVIAGRIERFAKAQRKMRRLGLDVTWWESESVQGNRSAITKLHPTNSTTESVTTARRRRRASRLSR